MTTAEWDRSYTSKCQHFEDIPEGGDFTWLSVLAPPAAHYMVLSCPECAQDAETQLRSPTAEARGVRILSVSTTVKGGSVRAA